MVRRRQVLQVALLGTAGALVPVVVGCPAAAATTHPFLLVKAEEFGELQQRASAAPWSTWRDGALVMAREEYLSRDREADLNKRARQMARIAGAASLAYILEPEAGAVHRQTILNLIATFDADLYDQLNSDTWQGTVAPSSALFHLVVGLDVIHPSLTSAQRTTAEGFLARAAEWYYQHRSGYWPMARVGGYGIWAAYQGDTARVDLSVQQIQVHITDQTPTTGGVYLSGPNYAGNRLGSTGDRDSKSYYIDVLTKIGKHDFYRDQQYVQLMEHYSGYLATPVLRMTGGPYGRGEFTFGESWADGGAVHRSARTWSAHRFGTVAAANAAWSLRGMSASDTLPLITAYVLTTEAPATDSTVPSRVFPGAGAWFHQPSTSHLALCGALWNPQKDIPVDHQNKGTNSLHLTAYGENVLRNAGYAGYPNGAAGFDYPEIAQRAVVNNTVLIDYDRYFTDDYNPPETNDHVKVTTKLPGNGIVESLLLGAVDYACGDSGTALPNGRHLRSLVFVRPDDDHPGYWIVFDEVRATTGNVPAAVAWHPNSVTDPQVVGTLTEYVSTVDFHPCTTNPVKLSVFLATPPTKVTVRSGPLAEGYVTSAAGRYLYCSYQTDAAGAENVVTVLFPFDATHPKPALTRVTGTGLTGARVTYPDGTTDHALESAGTTVLTTAGTAWRGTACVFRSTTDGQLGHYLLRKGRSFRVGDRGFTATTDVSVAMRGLGGRIHNGNSSSTTVTFYQPGLTKVRLNGVPAPVVNGGIGWLSVTVPVGDRTVELVTATSYVAEADTYVRGGDSANARYGNLDTLVVKADANINYRREAYLRFDLSAHPYASTTGARVRLTAVAAGGGACTLEVAEVTDSGWDEYAVCWSASPPVGAILDTAPAPAAGAVVDLDVTDHVNAVLAGTGSRKISLRLRILENGEFNSVTFGSREQADPIRRPILDLL